MQSRSDISTHALTEGDRSAVQLAVFDLYISTHALTEGDVLCIDAHTGYEISTHALTEGDAEVAELRKSIEAFQLTPSRRATYLPHMILDATIFQLTPSRRATVWCYHERDYSLHFNSRPHGGRHLYGHRQRNINFISTHALTEGDRYRP